MQTKQINPITYLPPDQAPPILQAYYEINHLKHLFRQGWLRRGIGREICESVAEHTFGMTLLTLLLASDRHDLDLLTVLKMALLHDLGEIYAGDITPADQVSDVEKHTRERQSAEQLFLKLPGGDAYLALWEEYEAGQTPEAQFVKQIDRLEMGLQATIYEHQHNRSLDEFITSTSDALKDPALTAFFEDADQFRWSKPG